MSMTAKVATTNRFAVQASSAPEAVEKFLTIHVANWGDSEGNDDQVERSQWFNLAIRVMVLKITLALRVKAREIDLPFDTRNNPTCTLRGPAMIIGDLKELIPVSGCYIGLRKDSVEGVDANDDNHAVLHITRTRVTFGQWTVWVDLDFV